MDINVFLEKINMLKYKEVFEQSSVDMDIIDDINKDDLVEIGVSRGDAIRILKAIASLHKGDSIKEPPPANYLAAYEKELPFMLAVIIKEYIAEEHPVVKLWYICDFAELLLRLLVIIGIAITRKDGELPEKLVKKLRSNIEYPTLGKWRRMALDTYGKEIEEIDSFFEGESEKTSLLKMRNLLAHGGGMTRKKGEELLRNWEGRFQELVSKLEDLNKYEIITKDNKIEEYLLLRGSDKDFKIYKPNKRIALQLEKVKGDGSVFLITEEKVITLWPLSFAERLEYDKVNQRIEFRQNIYIRKGEASIQYTPIGSEIDVLVESDESTYASFNDLFKFNRKSEGKIPEYLVRDFQSDIQKDSGELIGREEELKDILKLIERKFYGVVWLSGTAGSGKSFLAARVAMEIIEFNNPRDLVLVYRFRSGDDRCNIKEFRTFLVERIINWQGTVKEKNMSKADNTINTLNKLLENVRDNHRVVIVVDGIDELPNKEIKIVEDITDKLAHAKVLWFCVGRTELDMLFEKGTVTKAFKDGLPPMRKEEIREIILSKIGILRKKLLQQDRDEGDIVINPFIDKVVEYSKGLPIYVKYLLGDIIEGKIKNFAEDYMLPRSLDDYHKKLLDSKSITIYDQLRSPLVGFLAIAKEPITLELMCDYLVKRRLITDSQQVQKHILVALNSLASIIRKVSTQDDSYGYIFYHQSLNEHIRNDTDNEMLTITAKESLYDFIRPTEAAYSPLDIYLFRWGVRHLLEEFTERKREKLLSVFLMEDYLKGKLLYQRPEYFIDDLYDGYNLLNIAGQLEGKIFMFNLLKILLWQNSLDECKLDTASLHSLMVYRSNKNMYKQFLRVATDEQLLKKNGIPIMPDIIYSLLGNLANLERREGNLENAASLLRRCTEMNYSGDRQYKELAKLEYEIAYIHLLQGNGKDAFYGFGKSVQYADLAKDKIGYYMSKCVQYSFGEDKETFMKILNEAMEVFQENELKSEHARRWVYNVYVHRFMAAYELGKLEICRRDYYKVIENQWFKKYGDEKLLQRLKARLAVLENRLEDAEDNFRNYLLPRDGVEVNAYKEGLAKEYLEFAKVLIRGDKITEAMEVIRRGLNCPDNYANSYYAADLNELLDGIS